MGKALYVEPKHSMSKDNVSKSTAEISTSRIQKQGLELTKLIGDLEGFEKFISIRLYQFRLTGTHSPQDVVNECMRRYYEARAKEKPIPNTAGWLRKTALNYIHELSREERKADTHDPATFEFLLIANRNHEVNEDDPDYKCLHRALDALPQAQQELLKLRFFQNLSWEEISFRYSERGEQIQVPTLRKRGERALRAVRSAYLRLVND
jgi:RNA polymerase sigma factor (sigma-70 family)